MAVVYSFCQLAGRALGLFAPGGGETFLWVNPALSSAESAHKLFCGPGLTQPRRRQDVVSPRDRRYATQSLLGTNTMTRLTKKTAQIFFWELDARVESVAAKAGVAKLPVSQFQHPGQSGLFSQLREQAGLELPSQAPMRFRKLRALLWHGVLQQRLFTAGR